MINDLLYSAKKDRGPRVLAIKNSSSFSQMCELSDKVTKHSYLCRYFFGNPLPRTYDVLGYLPGQKKVRIVDNIKQEIHWTLMAVRRYKAEIALFVEYKQEFDKLLLLGNYEQAWNILGKVEREIGVSLWTLENKFLLLEQSVSPEEHKLLLSDFNESNKGLFATSVAAGISNRSEKNFSVLKFNSDWQNITNKFRGNLAEQNKEYYLFKVNFFSQKKYKHYSSILAFDFYYSIIDRYLSLCKILKLMYTDDESSIDIKSFVFSKCQYLHKKFNDNYLSSIVSTGNSNLLKKVRSKKFNKEALDFYTQGKYEDAIRELGKELLSDPCVFEYYPLYVKSFIYLKKEFVCPSGPEVHICFQNTILYELLGQLAKNINPQISAVNIERIIKNLSANSVSDGIHLFYAKEFNVNATWKDYNVLSLSCENPLLTTIYSEDNDKMKYLNHLKGLANSSITDDYFISKLSSNFIEELNQLEIPEDSKKIDLAKHYQKIGELDSGISIWEELLFASERSGSVLVYETAVTNLFNCYYEAGLLNDAVSLYVNGYIVNKYIVQKINQVPLRQGIRKAKFKNVKASIDLPLFYTLGEADENETHIAYEKFLDSLGVEKPSHLEKAGFEIDRSKLIPFLWLTCTTELFKHSIYIDGSKQGFNERIAVCIQLLSIDSANSEKYKKEIDSITNILIVQEGLQQLDESKIYVNEQGLINFELKEFEGLFNRYKTVARIFNQGRPLTLFIKSAEELSNATSIQNILKAQLSNHPLNDTFKEIFDVIIDKFLNSKFGISAYLSTRIRHGVLLGEIRPVFEKFYLIAQFDKNTEKYREVDFWNSRYKYIGDSNRRQLQNAISSMSQKIDKLIHELIKENLQIRLDESNSSAWFDYSFDETVINTYALHFKDYTNYGDFIIKAIEFLWERTDKNLEIIRGKIQTDVMNSFNSIISDFTSDLSKNNLNTIAPEVLTFTTTCSTEVQNSVEKIASWFNRSGSQTSDFNISKVIEIVLEKINQSNSSKVLECELSLQDDILIKGEFYSHIADLFRIFFNNALVHSDEAHNEIPLYVNASNEEGILSFEIRNKYPDVSKVVNIHSQNEYKFNSKKLLSEGKSGLHKASKIVKSDLKSDKNECISSLNEDGEYCVSVKIALDKISV
jgi:uncharacterized protein (UPF0305 family)